jgi:GR25 family glycosyltransferase involved in LPS biosynthesis
MDAVRWRASGNNVDLTPLTRLFITKPHLQKQARLSHRQMDSPASIGIMMSHIKCWEWLLRQEQYNRALILEDDACFDNTHFPDALQNTFAPLLQASDQWDVVVLGYYNEGEREQITTIGDVSLFSTNRFFGTHAYLVTKRAAKILISNAHPLEQQSDGYILTLGQLALLRVYLLHSSIVTQCMDGEDRQGHLHTGATILLSNEPAHSISYTTGVLLLLMGFFIGCIITAYVKRRRQSVSS